MTFQPGFRISKIDILFMFAILVLSPMTAGFSKYFSLIILVPMVQFFLFCNVFRVRRIPELIWTSLFILLAAIGYWFHYPYFAIMLGGLLLGVFLILLEMKHPSYHGILWQKINPGLEEWFQREMSEDKNPTG